VDLRQHIEEELNKDFQLLKEYENEKRNENDPGLRNKWETKIQSIKQDIKKRQEGRLKMIQDFVISGRIKLSQSNKTSKNV